MRSATEAAAAVARREVASRELVELVLESIDRLNPELNAVVELRPEAALEQAGLADRAVAAGRQVGPLHGVPMTIKESFDVAGLRTTWGNPAFRDHVSSRDATVVRRLQDAGAIIVGKTNVPFMLADFGQTANELYGATTNPWDTTRSPGGSSGGAAVAVAAGMSFLEFGSDLVGSLRIPASFCGVYGVRPSVGIMPLTGFQPPGPAGPPRGMTYMLALGPLARSPRDLRAALEVTAGPEPPAANAYGWQLAQPRHGSIKRFRVGVVLDHELAPVSRDVAGKLSDAVDALATAGATIAEGWPEGIEPQQTAESFGFHVDLFFAFQQGEAVPSVEAFAIHESRRLAWRAAWSRYFEEVDVFLCPANFTPAIPLDDRPFAERTVATAEGERAYTDQVFWITHASLPGLPAVIAPIGRTGGGLPVGAQIIGPIFEDDTAITFAELMAGVVGGFEPPPLSRDRGARATRAPAAGPVRDTP